MLAIYLVHKKVTFLLFGLALSAGIICASLALGEAGIEMYDLVSSCSLVSVNLSKTTCTCTYLIK